MGERGTTIVGVRKNGEEFPADAAISKLDVGGTRILTVALRDVTEQKRRESEQRFLAEVGSVLAATLDDEEMLGHVARMAVRDFADLCIVDVVDDDGAVRRRQAVEPGPVPRLGLRSAHEGPGRSEPSGPDGVGAGDRATRAPAGPLAGSVASFAETEEQLRALRALDPRSALVVPLAAGGKLLGVMGFVSSTPSRAYGPADLRARRGARAAGGALDRERAALSCGAARHPGAGRRARHRGPRSAQPARSDPVAGASPAAPRR